MKLNIFEFQVSAATAAPIATASTAVQLTRTASNAASHSGSQEKVSRKFSNPHHISSSSPSPKLLPGRAASPGNLHRSSQPQPQQTSFDCEARHEEGNMKSLVMPEEHSHHSIHNNAVARASEVLVIIIFLSSILPPSSSY